MMKILRYFLYGSAIILIYMASIKSQQDLILFDFESDNELDKFEWKCKTRFSLSNENVTHGNHSLKFEFYPSEYPGITPLRVYEDWSNYRIFAIDLFNPSSKLLKLYLRIDDTIGYNNDYECFNQRLVLEPGINHVQICLIGIYASRSHRLLDLGAIKSIILFMESPCEKVAIYTDFWRLER